MHTVTLRPHVLLVLFIVAAIGATDAVVASTWDLAVLFLVISAIALVTLLRSWTGRRSVPVRSDLARWLHVRADEGGERVDDLVDRAIAAHRAGISFDGDPEARQ